MVESSIQPKRYSVVAASAVMVVLSLALFFLPLVNGLVGGLVGGYMAGSVKRGLVAALLPAVIVALGLFILLLLLELPLLAVAGGLAAGATIILADLGLFIGAAIGGALAHQGTQRRVPA